MCHPNLDMGSSVLLQLPEPLSGFFLIVFFCISDILSLINQTQTTTLMYMKMCRNNRGYVSELPNAKSAS